MTKTEIRWSCSCRCISHAQRLLAISDQKVLAIALDSGFGSVSRFNAAFKEACGCSPHQYRAEYRV